MDSFFGELFEIVKRQVDTEKMNGLLPKVYHELDILVQYENISELNEIYNFVIKENPIKTSDSIYNDIYYLQLQKQILKHLFQLKDYTILNEIIDEWISGGIEDDLELYMQTWEDSVPIYNYFRDRIEQTFTAKPKKKPVVKKTIQKDTPKPIKKEAKVQEKTEVKAKPEETTSTPVVKKDKASLKPIKKEIVTKPIETKTPIKKEKPVEYKKPYTPKKQAESWPTYVAPRAYTPPKEPVKEAPKPVEKPKQPVEVTPEKLELMNLVNIMTMKYGFVVNKEKLKSLHSPKPTFFLIVLDFVESQVQKPVFFFDIFQLLEHYSYPDLIQYIISRSILFRKLASLHIGLVQEPEIKSKQKLLDLLKENDTDYIVQSRKELELKLFIDNLELNDEIVSMMKSHAESASIKAPLMADALDVSSHIHYFKNNIISKIEPVVDESNPAHLYWSMILAACLGIYVKRDTVYEFIDLMDYISKSAILLIDKINDTHLQIYVRDLAKTYIRAIYKNGSLSEHYEEWWVRQKDDFLNSKLNGISALSGY